MQKSARCSLATIALACLLLFPVFALALPPYSWPVSSAKLSGPVLEQACAKIDAEARPLPPELLPAVQFQKTFWRIISSAPESSWLPELQRFIAADGAVPASSAIRAPSGSGTAVIHAVAELSRAWLARHEMSQIDGVLRTFYRKHVAFPEQFAAIEADLPEALRRDPWGEPWVYRSHAPTGLGERFAKFTTQRYQLGPTRFPELGTLAQATGERKAPILPCKITARSLGGKNALEFRADLPRTSVTTMEPGGQIDGFTLVFIGDGWALLATKDQLFTQPF